MNKEEVLSAWKNSINSFKKVRFPEARKLYLQYKNESNSEKKTEIRNKLIEGSLYIVINYIENSLYSKLNQNCYDISDIINAFIVAWSEELCSDRIFIYKSYNAIYSSRTFCKKVADNIFGDYSIGYNEFTITVNLFEKQFEIYTNMLKNSPDVKYSSDEEYFICEAKKENCYDENINVKKLFSFFDSIINSFDCDINELKIGFTNISLLRHILIKNGYENYYNATTNAIYDNIESGFERLLLNNQIRDFVRNNNFLTSKEREVINHRFGLIDGKQLTLEELRFKLNISRERVRQIEVKALHKHNIYMPKNLKPVINNIKEDTSSSPIDTDVIEEISEEEYTKIINSYGNLVLNKSYKFNEKHGRYPTWDEIKLDLATENIIPETVIIDKMGNVYITKIYIKGVKPQDISCYMGSMKTTKKVLISDESKTGNSEAQEKKDTKLVRETIIDSLKDWPAYYNHLGYEYKNDIEIIKIVLSLNPRIIYYHLPSLDKVVYDNEDVMMEFIDDKNVYLNMSDRLKNNPKFISDCIRKGKYIIYSYLNEDIKMSKEVIEAMLEINPSFYMSHTKIENYKIDVLKNIFEYQQIENAVIGGCYNILKLYKKLMLHNGYVSPEEFINNIISLIKDHANITADIYDNLPAVVKKNRNVVLACVNTNINNMEEHLRDIVNNHNDDEEIMRIIISNHLRFFNDLSFRLKTDMNFILSFENDNPDFIDDLYCICEHDLETKFLYFTSPRTLGKNITEIVRSSSSFHDKMYFYLKTFTRSDRDFIKLYKELIKKLPSLVRSCPGFLEHDDLMYIYVDTYKNKGKYINNLRSCYGYPKLDFDNKPLKNVFRYPEYDDVFYGFSKKGILIVKKDNLYGVIDVNTNEVIIPCLYEKFMDSYNAWKTINFIESNTESLEKTDSYQRTKNRKYC